MAVNPEAIRAAFVAAYASGATPKDAALAFGNASLAVFPQIKTSDGSKYPADAWKYGFGQDFVLDGNGERVIDPRTLRPKRVEGTGGHHKATTDPERIAGAWTQFPQALVGTVVPEGYVVLDLDRHGAGDGVATFEALLGKHGQSLRTLTSGTPRNGRHLCLRLKSPQELPRADKLEGLPGIEIIPSGYWISEGPGYSLHDDAEPAEMPGWLYTALRKALPQKPERQPATIETGQTFGVGQRLVKVPASAYQRELADTLKALQGAEQGTRNKALLEASRRIGWCVAEGGISEEHARDRLEDVASEIGLAASEIQGTIRSGFAWAVKNPRISDRIPAKAEPIPAIPEPMQFLSFSEVLDLKIPPELMKGLIPASGVGYLYGDTGTFKTFIAIMLGYHVVEGLPLCGRKVKQRPVFYLLLEGAGSSPKRFRALDLWHHNNGNENPISNDYKFWMHNFNLTDSKQVDNLIATINESTNNGALVIIDTQSQASIGADENSAKDMTVILGNAKRISDDTNSVVMLIHHTGKDASRAHRGSSAQKANVDFSIKTVKGADGKSIQLVSDKERDEEKDQTVQFEIKIQDVGYDEDGEPITSCVAVPVCGDKKFTPALNIQGALKDKLDTFKDILKEYNKESITYSEWKDGIFKRNPHKTEGANNSDLSRSKGDLVKNELVSTDGVNFWLSEKARQL